MASASVFTSSAVSDSTMAVDTSSTTATTPASTAVASSLTTTTPGGGPAKGRIGWTKFTGYPMWPTRLADENEASEQVLRLKKDKHILVFFFGTHDFAWVAESNFIDFDANYEQHKNCKRKDFQAGLKEAVEWRDHPEARQLPGPPKEALAKVASTTEDAMDTGEDKPLTTKTITPPTSPPTTAPVAAAPTPATIESTASKAPATTSPSASPNTTSANTTTTATATASPTTTPTPITSTTSTAPSTTPTSPKEDMKTTIITLPNFKKKQPAAPPRPVNKPLSSSTGGINSSGGAAKPPAPGKSIYSDEEKIPARPVTARSKAMMIATKEREEKERQQRAEMAATQAAMSKSSKNRALQAAAAASSTSTSSSSSSSPSTFSSSSTQSSEASKKKKPTPQQVVPKTMSKQAKDELRKKNFRLKIMRKLGLAAPASSSSTASEVSPSK